MKTLLNILILFLIGLNGNCQLIDTKFLTLIMSETKNNTASYIKETYKTESGYKILIFNNPKFHENKNKIKEQISECNYKSINPIIEDGIFKDQTLNGQYSNGEMTGLWYAFNQNGNIIDTLDYSFEIKNNKYINNNPNTKINKTVDEFSSDNILKMANYMYYPPRSKLKNEQGKVIMEITTNSNGEIIQINIKNSISKDIDKESVRILLKYFPKVKNWKGTYPLKFGLY